MLQKPPRQPSSLRNSFFLTCTICYSAETTKTAIFTEKQLFCFFFYMDNMLLCCRNHQGSHLHWETDFFLHGQYVILQKPPRQPSSLRNRFFNMGNMLCCRNHQDSHIHWETDFFTWAICYAAETTKTAIFTEKQIFSYMDNMLCCRNHQDSHLHWKTALFLTWKIVDWNNLEDSTVCTETVERFRSSLLSSPV